MEHIKIFNSVNEKNDYIDADSFKYDIVGLVKNVEGVVYNPPEEVIHQYDVSNVTYDTTVSFDSTENLVSWDYVLDKTTRSQKHIHDSGTDSQTVEYSVNTSSTEKDISGAITKYGVDINYKFTQEKGTDKFFTFTALEDGTFTFSGNTANTSIQYSIDGGNTWVTLNSNVASPTVTAGNKIIWKGELVPITAIQGQGIGKFISTGKFDVSGNIMSLLYGDNFTGKTSLSGKDHCFRSLFRGSKVVNAEALILPATTLEYFCYYGMFYGCTNLITVPQLPAKTMAINCYDSMFGNCTSLVTVPLDLLPGNSLNSYCYMAMFKGCTALTNTPTLSASSVYYGAYYEMFSGCASLETAPILSATSIDSRCYVAMFKDCTSLKEAPVLPATSLREYCYYQMFKGCTLLNKVTCLATNISSMQCVDGWLDGVANNGTFTKAASMGDWTRGINGIPDSWTVIDAS